MNTQDTVMSDGFPLNVSIRGNGKPILVVGSSVYYPACFRSSFIRHFN